jgi:Tfp pilus assembly protein PilX
MSKAAGRLRARMPARTQRGDVPGWVLITVMTAALVAGLLAIAGPELNQMLREALASVG